jgi:hypothetical protein
MIQLTSGCERQCLAHLHCDFLASLVGPAVCLNPERAADHDLVEQHRQGQGPPIAE